MSIVRGSVMGTITPAEGHTRRRASCERANRTRVVLATGERRTREFNVRGSGIEEGS